MNTSSLALENGNYSTPADYVAKKHLSTRLHFYLSVLRNINGAAKISRAGKFTDDEYRAVSARIVHNIEEAGGRVTVENLDALSSDQWPCVIVGNHMGTLDPILLPSMLVLKGNITFVVKDSLMRYPIFSDVLTTQNPIVVGRVNPREDLAVVLREGEKAIQQGRSVVVFPQHTRRPTFVPEEFNKIGVKLAKRAGVPIAPLALKTDFLAQGKIIKEFGPVYPSRTVRFAYSAPMEITGNGVQQHQACIDFIQSKFDEWNDE